MGTYIFRYRQPLRLSQRPSWGAHRPGGPPRLFSRLMGDLHGRLDAMGRPLLALEHEGEPRPRAKGPPLALDVSGFSPEELSVTLEGRNLTVLGRHERQTEDADGCVSREYREVRKELLLPADADLEAVACALASDGQLRVDAPRLERTIPVDRSPPQAGDAAGRPKGAEEEDGARGQ